ncbi:MAG: beta-propeller fold lactonase family protein [Candidatus Sulfotelmatobacter sp.]
MRTRFTWIVAILALVLVGVLIACSTKYSSSSNGLVIVPSQGGGPLVNNQPGGPVMETFSIDLANGHASEINNVNGPPISGLPQAVVLDPAGAFAYVIVYQNAAVPDSVTGIETFPVASDGKLGPGTMYPLKNAKVQVQVKVKGQVATESESVPVLPAALQIDSAGKFLFVADSATSDSSGNPVPGAVSVLSVGSGGSLTEVPASASSPASPFVLPVGGTNLIPPSPCNNSVTCPSPLALAVTPTIYPQLYAPCSGFTAPTSENLYVTDSVNYLLLNYSVSSTGSLTLVPTQSTVGVPTGTTPDGVTVDPCNRFVYVANGGPGNSGNSVSAYTICSTVSLPTCQNADHSLLPVTASPFVVSPGNAPGPLAVDAYGNFLYVVDAASGIISSFKITPTTGSLTPLNPSNVSAGPGANSIAIRSDDSWMFVANSGSQGVGSQTLSEYGITPATGELTPQPPISTFNYPSGVAVH